MSGETYSQLLARDFIEAHDALEDAHIERLTHDMLTARRLLREAKTETKRRQFAEIVNVSKMQIVRLLGSLPPGRTRH